MEGRSLRSSAGVGQEEEEEESGDEEEEGEKDTFPSWKKTIMIGPSYQASVPSGTTNYDDRFAKQAVFFSAGIINLTFYASLSYTIYIRCSKNIFSALPTKMRTNSFGIQHVLLKRYLVKTVINCVPSAENCVPICVNLYKMVYLFKSNGL